MVEELLRLPGRKTSLYLHKRLEDAVISMLMITLFPGDLVAFCKEMRS